MTPFPEIGNVLPFIRSDELQESTLGKYHRIRQIQRSVCLEFNITLDDMLGKKRSHYVKIARHYAIYLTLKLTSYPSDVIADHFNRERSIVPWVKRKIGSMTPEELAEYLEYGKQREKPKPPVVPTPKPKPQKRLVFKPVEELSYGFIKHLSRHEMIELYAGKTY